MAEKKLVIEFTFEDRQEYEDEPSFLVLTKIAPGRNDLSDDERIGVMETWAQSDSFYTETVHHIMAAVDGQETTYEE